MKTEFKTASILLGTFIVGGVLGFMLHATFVRSDFQKHAMRMRTPEGFIHRFERVIEPTEEQRKEIREILRSHYKEMNQYRDTFHARMDSVREQIEALLTDEQKERLKKEFLFNREPEPSSRRHEKRHYKPEPFEPPPPPPESPMN